MHELLRAHFQREDGDGLSFFHRDVLRDVHRKSCFTHRRTRRDHDHLRAVQTVGHLVERLEACLQSGDLSAAIVKFLDVGDGPHHHVLHRRHLLFEAVLGDVEDLFLHLVEQHLWPVLFVVAALRKFGADPDDPPQHMLREQVLDVMRNVRRRGEEDGKLVQVGWAADGLQQVPIAQVLRDGDELHRPVRFADVAKGLEELLVRRQIKGVLGDALFAAEVQDLFGRKQNGRENASLRVRRLWEFPVKLLNTNNLTSRL